MLSYFKTYLFKNSTEPRTKEEEKSKGIQTTTITPIQPTTQPTVNPEIQSQLMKAILDGSIEGAKKAISAGADINNVESDGKTPLWQALLLGKFGIVNALLESGAKTDIPYKGKKYGLVLDVGGYKKNVFTIAPSLYITNAEIDMAMDLLDQLFIRCK